ncbi:FAD-dependent monooxygenase [Agrococcus casei]|uniref:Monooxygenase, FAD-binding n=1 Tax=Agrococcus casei LMG 22410 TaxID=1255656 RepID=A0A1R4GEB7_9MICO|nr:FAD-dependent monooxygenase [Agrococcus casei]SJM66541.1 monooxygenase, FAD-binding [Agrococcus casei LMG 22410]
MTAASSPGTHEAAPHALISGGGIAGLANAIALGRIGWRCTVVEQAPAPREGGYMIDVFGAGWKAARELCVLQQLRAVGHAFQELRYIDATGRTTASIPLARVSRSLDHEFTSVLRPDIEQVLLRGLPAGTEVRYGTTVTSIEQHDDAAVAELSDGSESRADLIVAADGLHSSVRRLAFGDERQFVRSLGYQVGAFICEAPELARKLGSSVHLTDLLDRQLGVFALNPDTRGAHPDRVSGFVLRRDTEALPDDPAAAIRDELQHHGPIGEALRGLVGSNVYFDTVAQAFVPRWQSARVVLAGDAAHAVSLIAGQGAAMAMAGALQLADAVDRHGAVGGAAEYERVWRPVVEGVQRSGRRGASAFVPSTRVAQAARRGVARLARVPGVSALVARSIAGRTH